MSVRFSVLLVAGVLACSRAGDVPPVPMPTSAQRIVSLGPSLTNILWALGASSKVVARSRFDDTPTEVTAIRELGDAIRPNVESIIGSTPDLVVLYKTPDNVDAEQALNRAGIPVLSLRIDSIEEFLDAIDTLSALVQAEPRGDSLALTLRRELRDASDLIGGNRRRPSVFLPVWERPLMTLGSGSYLSELVGIAGGRNIFGDTLASSFTVSMEEVVKRDPDLILASPTTVTRITSDRRWQGLRAVKEGRVLAIDTTLISQPTMRMGAAARSLVTLINASDRK